MPPKARALPRPFFNLSPAALFAPRADFILTSGLSIMVVGAMILWTLATNGWQESAVSPDILGRLLLLQVLLNWPHFMVSYWVLYRSPGAFRDYPAATVIVPALLLALAFAASMPILGGNGINSLGVGMSSAIWIFASLYLAWHYTGQTWGVMMSFGHLSGLKLTQGERLILRGGLRVMVAWHVIWAIQTLAPLPLVGWFQGPMAMTLINLAAVLAFGAGAVALARAARRGGSIDIRVLGAWVVLYMWYLLLSLMPAAFMVVQLSHSLQYLGFPLRMELNRTPARGDARLRAAGLYLAAVLAGLVVFYLPGVVFVSPDGRPTLVAMLGILINIHHYYTDSAIWKLRKSSVTGQLFAHVAPARK